MIINNSMSVGDFIDRYSILEIKSNKNLPVENELHEYIKKAADLEILGLTLYKNILLAINECLWNLEDKKRMEVKRYTKEYSDVSTLITQLNDLRFQAKNKADIYFESEIQERKSHKTTN